MKKCKVLIYILFLLLSYPILVDAKETRFGCNYELSDPEIKIRCDVYDDYSHLCYMTVPEHEEVDNEESILNWSESVVGLLNWTAKEYVQNTKECPPYLVVRADKGYDGYQIDAAYDNESAKGLLSNSIKRYIISNKSKDVNESYKTYEPFKCTYETNFFNTNEAAKKWVLETNEDGNKLVKATCSDGTTVEFDGDGIETSGDKCPNVSIYQKILDGNYKIFANQEACFDSWGSTNSLCSENLKGEKNTSDTSISSDADSGVQYSLTKSSGKSCSYSNKKYGSIKVTNKNKNLSASCDTPTSICFAKIENSTVFFNGSNFTCPEYIYANTELDYHGNTGRYNVTIYDAGGSTDTNREEEEGSTEASNGKWDPDSLCGPNNENCNIDITEFCTDPYVSRTLKFLGLLLSLAKIIIPAIIIGMGFVDLAKIVISGKMDIAKKQ